MEGDVESATLRYIIRDHDRMKFEQKKDRFQHIAAYLNEQFGEGSVTLTIKDSYYNMKEKILPVMHVVERAKAAMRAAGMEPKEVPVRGGTDGARLSFEGLPCPNLCTGGMNFHGVHECIPVFALERMTHVQVAVCIRRAVVQNEEGLALVAAEGLAVKIHVVPGFEHARLARGQTGTHGKSGFRQIYGGVVVHSCAILSIR